MKLRISGVAIATLVLCLSALVLSFLSRSYKVSATLSDHVSDTAVRMGIYNGALVYQPRNYSAHNTFSHTGLLLFAQSSVPPEAYSYFARQGASAGHPSVVVPYSPLILLPLNTGILASLKSLFPSVTHWVLAGNDSSAGIAQALAATTSTAGLVVMLSAPNSEALQGATDVPTLILEADTGLGSTDALGAHQSRMGFAAADGPLFGNYQQEDEVNSALAANTPTIGQKQVSDALLGFLASIN